MAITLQDSLQLDGLNRGRVVAGRKGLKREVHAFTVLDRSAPPFGLRGGELVLLQPAAVPEGEAPYHRLIPALVAAGCAGLLIRTDVVPGDLIAAADEHGLPVVALPHDVPVADLITPLMERILAERGRNDRTAEAVNRTITRAVLSGGGLSAILELVGAQTGCRTAVVDKGLRCVAVGPGVDQPDLLAWLDAHDPMSELWLGAGGEAPRIPGPDGNSAVNLPIRVNAETLGYMLVWPWPAPPREELSAVLEHAVMIAALELLKEQAVRQVEHRYQDEMLADLLHGRFADEPELRQRSRHLPWDLSRRYRVLLFDLSGLQSSKSADALRQTVLEASARAVQGMSPRPLQGLVGGDLAMLLPDGQTSRLHSALAGVIRAVQFQIAHMTRLAKPTVGVSESVSQPLRLKEAYSEAREALQLGRVVHGPEAIAYFEQLGLYRLLKDVDPARREAFVGAVIGPVQEHDRQKNGGLLMETLEAYLEAKGQAKVAASRLFVHVNTVKYRLNQIEDLTGHSPETPDGIVSLTIALKLMDLMGRHWRKQ